MGTFGGQLCKFVPRPCVFPSQELRIKGMRRCASCLRKGRRADLKERWRWQRKKQKQGCKEGNGSSGMGNIFHMSYFIFGLFTNRVPHALPFIPFSWSPRDCGLALPLPFLPIAPPSTLLFLLIASPSPARYPSLPSTCLLKLLSSPCTVVLYDMIKITAKWGICT